MTVQKPLNRALSSTASAISCRIQKSTALCSTAHGQASANTSGFVLWNSADLQLPLEQGCPSTALQQLKALALLYNLSSAQSARWSEFRVGGPSATIPAAGTLN